MTADEIAHCLARNLFKSDLVVVDCCTWPGAECDLLVVTPRLQVIDVEIKISRADLKVDREKAKWFAADGDWVRGADGNFRQPRRPLEWPQRVWKHYYAMPAALWKPELAALCNARSGVITVSPSREIVQRLGKPEQFARDAERSPALWHHRVVRRAKPCPTYEPIGDAALRKIAFLASCRMWDAYWNAERNARDRLKTEALHRGAA